ncbi:MAG TPA: TetR/AcrR family transcriptional regulator [Candidatus Binatia bacterium]|jgi:AcrR family transcriptional regulator
MSFSTREKILASATKLFSAQGYANTSLAQVAKEAQVSKALIFWHFASKDELFRAALKSSLEPYSIDVVELLSGLDEIDQIRKLVDLYYEFVSQNVYSVRFLLSLVVREEKNLDDLLDRTTELYRIYCNLLADIMQTGREKKIFRSTVNPQADAALVMAALNGILVQGFVGNGIEPEPRVLLEQLKVSLGERLLGPG